MTASAEPAIAAIRRARKLEKLFGTLPPHQLYRANRPPEQLLPLPRKLVPRDDRERNSGSFERARGSQEIYDSVGAHDELLTSESTVAVQARGPARRRASTSSLYHASIASLRYIAQSNDESLISDFAKIVLDEADEAPSEDSASEVEHSEARVRHRKWIGLSEPGDGEESASRIGELQHATTLHVETLAVDVGDSGGPSAPTSPVPDLVRNDANAFQENGVRALSSIVKGKRSRLTGRSSLLRQLSLTNRSSGPAHELEDSSPGSADFDEWHDGSHRKIGKQRESMQTVLSGTESAYEFSGGEAERSRRTRQGGQHRDGAGREGGFVNRAHPSLAALRKTGHRSRPASVASMPYSVGSEDAASSDRSSMESVRIQFRRAHKLAHLFGTTRGEVFNKVLDDIVADLEELTEDEELDEEEKREVLENVAALRAAL